MRRSLVWLSVPVLLTAVATACSADGTWRGCDRSAGPIAHPPGADQVVLRMDSVGGLPPPVYVDEAPRLSVYGDGRVVIAVPYGASPRPALPELREARLTEAGLQEVLHEAEAACLLRSDHRLEVPGVYDVPFTTFVIAAAGEQHTTAVQALGFDAPGISAPSEQEAERATLLRLEDRLLSIPTWLPNRATAWRPYEPDEMRVYVQAATEPVTSEQKPADWPLAQALAELGDPVPNWTSVRCAVVRGRQLDALLPSARPAAWDTQWRDGGDLYRVYFRPLLPDEHGCP